MSLDAALRRAATAAVRVFATPGTLKVSTQGAYSSATLAATVTFADVAVLSTPLDFTVARLGVAFGADAVLQGDAGVLIDAAQLAAAPKAGDRYLDAQGRTWDVRGVSPIMGGATAAAYNLHLRR